MQHLRWECLCNRLKTLEPVAKIGDPEVIHELSNISSQLFDLKHHYLLIRNQKKLMLNQNDKQQLNELGKKSLYYTQTILKEKFPDHALLV